jgi:membrane peptidoglycan carboxypeptidase
MPSSAGPSASDVPGTPPSSTPRGRGKWAAAGLFTGASALAGVVAAGLLLPFAGAVGIGAKEAVTSYETLPAALTTPPLPQRTIIRDRNQQQIAQLFKENRVIVPLEQISVNLQRAVIATEDSRFYDHNGMDLKGTARALASNAGGDGGQQGASTITMQYVRNVLVVGADSEQEAVAARARSASRKLQEIRYAVEVEKQLSKSEILNNYLNISYFGAGAYGAEAAAHRYFNVSAADLNLTQAATLAGLVQSPQKYDPTRNIEASVRRRNQVLFRMLEVGDITKAQYQEAVKRPMADDLNPQVQSNGCAESVYPFFCDYVVRQVLSDPQYGKTAGDREKFLETGGITIDTTIDPLAQDAAVETVNSYIPPTDESGKAAAVAMVQPGTGQIVTMAQNRTWGTKKDGQTTYNYAVDQKDGGTIGMQAGSTFKIFTLAAALDAGIDPNERINASDGLWLEGGDWGCPGQYFGGFTGQNSTQSGFFNMWEATAYSTNTYFLQRERDAGLCQTVDMASRAGVTLATGKPLEPNISFTLGTSEVSPLSLANAYATFAAHGLYCKPMAITAITSRTGEVIVNEPECSQTIPRDVADGVTAVMTGVVDGPIQGRTGENMSLGRETTGKTGTTDSSAAVWFAGYTPDLATAVWVGDPRGGFKYPLRDITINGTYYDAVFGSYLPGPIWRDVMLAALSESDPVAFDLEAKYGLKSVQQGGGPGVRNGASASTNPYGYQYDGNGYNNNNDYNYNYNYNYNGGNNGGTTGGGTTGGGTQYDGNGNPLPNPATSP